MQADLHMHSTYSDGSLSIAKVVKAAKMSNADVISITDHDSFVGQAEAVYEAKRQGMLIIQGSEISAFDPKTGRKAHILCYSPDKPDLITKACRPYLKLRDESNIKAAENVINAGFQIDMDDILAYVGEGGVIHRQHIMHALMDRGHTDMIYGPLYRELFGEGGIAYHVSEYMTAEAAIKLVKEAGGLSVLAHPYQYDSMGMLESLVSNGLDGIECYHHTQTPERIEAVLEASEKYGLFISGGSDSHGLYSEKPQPIGSIPFELSKGSPLYQRIEAS